MVSRRHYGDADENADNKVGFEGLLLSFMTKELLAHNGTRPAACRAKHQQRDFRHPAQTFTRRHFIGAIHACRQGVNQQKPDDQRMRGNKASYCSENQK